MWPLRPVAVVPSVKNADAVCVDALQDESKDTGMVLAEGRASVTEFNVSSAQRVGKNPPLDVDYL